MAKGTTRATIADGDVTLAEPEPVEFERDDSGRLTLEGMKQSIRAGNSVFIDTGRGTVQCTEEKHLPSEAQYAMMTGDEADTARAVDLLNRKRAQIDADIQLLTGSAPGEGRIAPARTAARPPAKRAAKAAAQSQPPPPDDDEDDEDDEIEGQLSSSQQQPPKPQTEQPPPNQTVI